MDKEFFETCKLLQKYYTKITAENVDLNKPASTSQRHVEILSRAKEILTREQAALTDSDIEDLRQKSVVQYAQEIEKYMVPTKPQRKSLCRTNDVRWDDDIWNAPNPKRKSIYTNIGKDKEKDGIKYDCVVKVIAKENVDTGLDVNDDREVNVENIEKNVHKENVLDNSFQLVQYDLNKDILDSNDKKIAKNPHIVQNSKDLVSNNAIIIYKPGEFNDKNYNETNKELKEIDVCVTNNINGNNKCKLLKQMNRKELVLYDKALIETNNFNVKELEKITDLTANSDETSNVNGIDSNEIIPELLEIKNTAHNEESDENNSHEIDLCKKFTDLRITSKNITNDKNYLEIKKLPLEVPEEISTESKTESEDYESETIPENKEMQAALKKYFEEKRNKKRNKKINENINKQNTNLKVKIDNFLENVEKLKNASQLAKNGSQSQTNIVEEKVKTRKSKSLLSLSNNDLQTFQHRFKAQREIIELQKRKLSDQNKMIEALKLKKIEEEAKESMQNCAKIYQETASASKRFKYKARLIKEETQDVNQEAEGLNLSLSFCKAPKIVQCMEKRAKEREERRMLIKERKRLIEEEKKRMAEELVQKKKLEEIEEKNKKLKALREQTELVRQLEIQKKLERKQELEQRKKAFLHYRKKLLEYCFESLRDCVEQRKVQEEIAVKLHEFNTTLRFFRSWQDFSLALVNKRREKAEQCYNTKLKMRVFDQWKKFHQENVRKMQVAQDFYEMKLQARAFSAYHHLICLYHLEYTENKAKAIDHYHRQLLFQYFGKWQNLPAIMKMERKKDERRKKWRLKVAEILPDYNPNKDD